MSAQIETGVSDPVAEDINNFQQIPEEQLTDASNPDSRDVVEEVENVSNPQAENFKALRKEIEEKVLKIDELQKSQSIERENFQKQFEQLQRNLQEKQSPTPKHRVLNDYEDDYVPSVGEIRKAFVEQENSLREKMEEIEVIQKHSDYMDVIQNHFIPLVKEKPYLVQMIQNSPNKAQAAYDLGRLAIKPTESAPQTMSGAERAQRIVENARKPGNVANVGGSSVINKADYYANMSDADFAKLAKKNLSEI